MHLLSKKSVFCVSLLLYNAVQIIALPIVDEIKPKSVPTVASYKSGWCGLHIIQGDNQCKPDMWRCEPNTLDITIKDAAHKKINRQGWKWTGAKFYAQMPLMVGNPNTLQIIVDAPPQTDPEEHLVDFKYGADEWSIVGRQGASLPWGAKEGYRCSVGYENPPLEARHIWERQIDCGFHC